MAIGPVQLIVLGFEHPEFHGEIIAELERLKESDTVRVIDALAVYKDAERRARGRASEQPVPRTRRSSSGPKVGALIGLGIEGEEGMVAGAGGRRRSGGGRHPGVLGRRGVGRARRHPERHGRRAAPDRAPLGRAAARRDRTRRRVPPQRRLHQPTRPRRDRPDVVRRGQAAPRHGDGPRPDPPTDEPRGETTCSDPAESPAAPGDVPPGASPGAASRAEPPRAARPRSTEIVRSG